MKVLVCGGREYGNRDRLFEVLDALKARYGELTIIHGAAKGADSLADQWAGQNGAGLMVFPANWSAYGKSAGPVRNGEMLLRGKPDLVVAFPTPGAENVGTNNMIKQSIEAGMRVVKVEG